MQPRIWMQDSTSRWSLKGQIVAINDIGRIYDLLLDDKKENSEEIANS